MRYLEALGEFKKASTISYISSGLHPVWTFLLIHVMNYGVIGAALAHTLTNLLSFIIGFYMIRNRIDKVH